LKLLPRLKNLKKRSVKLKSAGVEKLGPELDYYPVSLTEEKDSRSRRQALGLVVKGVAFLIAWPLLKKESRAEILNNLVGQKAIGQSESLSVRKAAKIISDELAHTNVPHKNIAHQNVAHTNTHRNDHINESKHVDWGPPQFEHTNQTIHTDQNVETHVDTPHTDNPHQNEAHTNVEHANRPNSENS